MQNKLTKTEVKTVNNILFDLCQNYSVNHDWLGTSPNVSISANKLRVYDICDGINDPEVIETKELNKYDIADLKSNPIAFITSFLNDYFILNNKL